MDVRGWRKWLRTPAPTGTHQKQQEGMLKLLLGHWKSHRKKPSLLPEDGDIHFEDPSTINPLFEDSDSSLSSTKRATDSNPEEQAHAISQVENEQNETDLPVENELIDVSVPTHDNDTEISDLTVPKDEITDTEKDKSLLTEKAISNVGNLEKEKPLKSVEPKDETLNTPETPLHKNTTNNISSKDETETKKINSEEKMRIYNQPSTSAIREGKKHSDTVSGQIQQTALPTSKSAVVKKSDKDDIKEKPLTNKSHNDNDTTKSVLTPLKHVKQSSSPAKPIQSDNQDDKPTKLRARAIDELIKKFQGQTAKNDEEDETILKQEGKHSPSQPKEIEKPENKEIKTENKSISSLAVGNYDSAHKISKPVRKQVTKTPKPKIQTDSPNENGPEVEALSNIFKFPPPPPLEKLQNESSLHGKIAKDLKFTNPLSISSKAKETVDDKKENESGKTRSDSSLDRTRTASSNKPKDNKEKSENVDKKDSKVKEQPFKEPSHRNALDSEIQNKKAPIEKGVKTANEIAERSKNTKDIKVPISKTEASDENKKETKTTESVAPITQNNSPAEKESAISNHKTEAASNFLHKNAASVSSVPKVAPKSPAVVHKSSVSKASSKSYSVNESENVKSHSEDSGITRGDQISSETTQETPTNDPPVEEEKNTVPNSSRKSKKEKKLKSISKKACKNCKHVHNDSISMKRSQYDDYYDALTGARHVHKNRHSDSWTSDISWEEKELLRRLRSRRGTVRSNTPPTRSRHSKHHFIDENYFRRHHNVRRSFSDDSSFHGASLCSCDECWAQYIKDYAYGRASVRGMSPIQEMCTCQNSRHSFLGRRVQFRSDTIHEVSPSDRTTTTTPNKIPAPPAEKKQVDEADDKSSQKSSKSKDDDSVSTHPDGAKDKKVKTSEESYRFVTPWELEEWDLFMRKHLLQKRRRRARCMGVMALAMVVFVGLVVAILMVYLRRKVI